MGALTLTDNRKRVHHASLVSYIGKGDKGFSEQSFDLVKVEDIIPAKKQKVMPPPVDSQPGLTFQSPQISISTSMITSRKNQLPPPAPLTREVHGPQRSLKFMSSMSSYLKPWGGASVVRRDSADTSVASKENYTASESLLVETRRQAFEVVHGTRRDKTVNHGSPGCSNGAKLDKVVSSSECLEDQDRLAKCLDVENYRRMVDGILSDSTCKKFSEVPYCVPPKSPDDSVVNLDDGCQSSIPVMPCCMSLHSKNDATQNIGKPVTNIFVELEQRKPAYKDLQESIEKNRDLALRTIHFQIKLEEAKFAALSLTGKQKKLVEEFHKPFGPLTAEEEEEVSVALNGRNRRECLAVHESSNIEITRNILQCLLPGAWLNDEVINLYLELLKEREARNPTQFLRCHFFNTFFYKKLNGGRNGYDYKAVRRWTTQKKIGYGLIECDKIFIPIHKEIHWCLAVINVRDKTFQYLDSLGGIDSQALNVLARYLTDEVKDKNDQIMDFTSWEQEFVVNLPEQQNGYDCGMFMIKYADFYSRGMNLSFTQEHMPYFRKRTAKEILHLRAD